MYLIRAPLRIGFVGGGTDMAYFYTRYPGRVLSAAIDKYVYVLINPTPLIDRFTVKYQKTELVDHPRDLEHTRVREALLDLGIVTGGIEIGSFADIPARTGLGSSSSFSVALMKGLHAFQGRDLTPGEAAEEAARLEIDILGEPIGKQDQYAAAFGGMNVLQFNPDHSVGVQPVVMAPEILDRIQKSLLIFFTGITRDAGVVLGEQRANASKKFETLKSMADSVDDFYGLLKRADIQGLGEMLHEAWVRKKSLASAISQSGIDDLYESARRAGAYGGKVTGAGGGGCMIFFVPPEKHEAVRREVSETASRINFTGFREIPVQFVNSGCKILVDHSAAIHAV